MSQTRWLPNVCHDDGCFTLTMPGIDEEAHLYYDEPEENVMNLTLTDIPESMEGRGLASSLVRTACEYARSNDVKIIPTCTFVQAYLESNPDEQDVLKQ